LKIKKILLFLLSCSFLLVGCTKKEESEVKPRILVSISPYKFFLEQLAGDHFEIITIVPEGVNTHTYEPTAKSINRFDGATLWFQVGDPFEKKLGKTLFKHNPALRIYDLRNFVKLIPYHDHHMCSHHTHEKDYDLHVWLSPPLVATQCKAMAHILKNTFPDHDFQPPLASLLRELDDLDAEIHSLLKYVQHRTFLTSHPSFAYFCKEYELEQISIEVEGKEPLPKELDKIIKLAESKEVKVALLEPQFSAKGMRIIAKKMHIPARMVDPYSADYIKSMKRIAKVIKNPENP